MGNSQACFNTTNQSDSVSDMCSNKCPGNKNTSSNKHGLAIGTKKSLYFNVEQSNENEALLNVPKLVNDISPTFGSAMSNETTSDTNSQGGDLEPNDEEDLETDSTNYRKHQPSFDLNNDSTPKNNNNEKHGKHDSSRPIQPEREIGVKIIKRLGDGMSCTVFEVEDTRTAERYAMKRLRRHDKLAEWLFVSECNFLKKVRCKGIIQMIGCFADNDHYYILTELGTVDLFRRLKNAKCISEEVTREIVFRLLKTLALLHRHNIVHRDVKPENIVFTEKGTLNQPKLIDFGDVKVVKDDAIYNELVGTRCYLAPERWIHHYGYELKASDVWAVGVLAFEMVTGKRCFYAPSDEKLTEKNPSW